MLYASILLIIMVLGILLYALATNPKVQEMGRITFFCALLGICLQLGTKMIRLLG